MALKLDMMKVYDKVNWIFLVSLMRSFGFVERWIDMIWRLISNPWISILINGSPCGFFKGSRGLRKRDLLSPLLFIIGPKYFH